jgi:hypothetical protein
MVSGPVGLREFRAFVNTSRSDGTGDFIRIQPRTWNEVHDQSTLIHHRLADALEQPLRRLASLLG